MNAHCRLCWVVFLLLLPGLAQAQDRKEADDLLKAAKSATERGDHKQAIKDYTEAMSQLYFHRAWAYTREGEIDKAIADYTESIRLNPKQAMSYYNRGTLHDKKGDLDKAIADYSQVIRLEPTYTPAHDNRAADYCDKGDYEKAVADYKKSLQIDPEQWLPNFKLAWLLATCPKQEVRDGRKAVELARKACDLDGWHAPWRLETLAAAYAEVGDFKEAVKWAKEAVKSADGLLSKGQVDSIQERLKLYEQGKPYREKPAGKNDNKKE
jgi:tetratricopeptide (TPR) repeat protein